MWLPVPSCSFKLITICYLVTTKQRRYLSRRVPHAEESSHRQSTALSMRASGLRMPSDAPEVGGSSYLVIDLL